MRRRRSFTILLVPSLAAESARVGALARELAELEARYEEIRSLFGADTALAASDLWLPPSGAGRPRQGGSGSAGEGSEPTSWPLTERGFVTQVHLEVMVEYMIAVNLYCVTFCSHIVLPTWQSLPIL